MGPWLTSLAGFLSWDKLVSFVFKSVTFGKMVLVNTALVFLLGSYCWAVLKTIIFVYEKSNQFINLINDFTYGNGNEILSWAVDVLKAFGIWNAFVDAYNIFSIPIASIFIIYASKLGLKFFHSIQRTLIAYSIARL